MTGAKFLPAAPSRMRPQKREAMGPLRNDGHGLGDASMRMCAGVCGCACVARRLPPRSHLQRATSGHEAFSRVVAGMAITKSAMAKRGRLAPPPGADPDVAVPAGMTLLGFQQVAVADEQLCALGRQPPPTLAGVGENMADARSVRPVGEEAGRAASAAFVAEGAAGVGRPSVGAPGGRVL